MYQIKEINKVTLLAIMLTMFLHNPTTFWGQISSKNNTSYSYNSSKDNGETRIRFKNNKSDFEIEFKGDIKVSNDDKDIITISNGGFIEIKKSSFGSKRRILIESGTNEVLTKSYYVGRSEKEYNTEGRKWLAEILPKIVRSTTIGAESRVTRFYKKGGAEAVLNEISQIDSDYVKSTYFKLLLKNKMNFYELVSVIEKAGNEIKSDFYLSGILRQNQKAFLATNQTATAYINASKTIDSDHYKTEVLKAAINDKTITDIQMARLLEISKSVGSDHYITQVLTEIMEHRLLNSQNVNKIIELSKDIQSDYYKTQVLKKVINNKSLPSATYDALISTMVYIQSDYYMTQVIYELINSKLNIGVISLSSLLNVVKNNIQSDHYVSTIFNRLANLNLTEDNLITVLNAATFIKSDLYLSEALVAFSTKVNRSSKNVKQAFITTAKSINSTVYYGKAMKAINNF